MFLYAWKMPTGGAGSAARSHVPKPTPAAVRAAEYDVCTLGMLPSPSTSSVSTVTAEVAIVALAETVGAPAEVAVRVVLSVSPWFAPPGTVTVTQTSAVSPGASEAVDVDAVVQSLAKSAAPKVPVVDMLNESVFEPRFRTVSW